MSGRDKLILLVLAGGFLTLAVEVRYLHRNVLAENWQSIIPILFGPLAAFACGFALTGSRLSRWLCSLLMALGVGVGMFGTFLHSEGEVDPFARLLTASITARANGGEEERGERAEEAESEPPVLAPLSLSGLSAVGLLIVLPTRTRRE